MNCTESSAKNFPTALPNWKLFLYNILSYVHVVSTPETVSETEKKIRDPKDRPILRAALDAHADLFLTGDKDFLESSITDPRIISVADFLSN